MSKKPSALKFNVNKKLSQLMKVIQFFNAQLSEIEFQKNYLFSTYEPEMNSKLDDYSKKATESQDLIKEANDLMSKQLDKQYQTKIETLKSDLAAYVNAAVDNISKFEVKMGDDCSQILAEIDEINESIEKRKEEYEKSIDKFAAELDKSIAQEKDKFKQELDELNAKSNEKLKELQENNKKQLDEINAEHQKGVEGIMKPGVASKGKRQAEIEKKCDNIKNKIAALNKEIREMKANVSDLTEHNSMKLKQVREQSRGLQAEIANSEENRKKILAMNEEERKLKENEYKSKIEAQTNILELNKEKHKEDLFDWRNKQKTESDKMKIKYSDESQRIRDQFDNLDDSLQKLIDEQNKEIEKLKKKHEDYRKQAELRIKEKNKEAELMIKDNEVETKKLQDELNGVNTDHGKAKQERGIKREKLINAENERFIVEQQKLFGLKKESENSEESSKNRSSQLAALLEEISKMRMKFDKEISDYEAETDQLVNSKIAENDTSINAHRVADKAEYDSTVNQYNKKLKELNEKQDAEYEELKARLEKEFESTLQELRNNGLDRKELTEFVQKYTEIFNVEKKKLDGFEDIQAEDFSALDNEIRTRKLELDEAREKIETERANIAVEWTQKFTEEDRRHGAIMGGDGKGDEREQLRIKVVKELEEERQSRLNDEADINKKISDETAAHKEKMEAVKKKLDELIDRTHQDALEKTAKDLQDELDDLNRKMNQSEQMKVEEHKKNIHDVNENFENAKKELDKNEEEILGKIKRDRQEMENDLATANEREESALENAKDLAQKQLQLEDRNFQREKDRLLKDIEESKKLAAEGDHGSDKVLLSNRSRHESEEIVLIKENEAEIQKINKDWSAMNDFYEERITVLQERVDKARNRMATLSPRPQEVAMIEKLTGDLSLITYRLKNAAIELKNDHELVLTQEKVYNQKFGKSPKIGILPTAKSSLK